MDSVNLATSRESGDIRKVVEATSFVPVNYGISVEKFCELYNCEWVDNDIAPHAFTAKRTGEASVRVELVRFSVSPKQYISTVQVLRSIGDMRYRPAELHELLAFSKSHPDAQGKFSIVALGSIRQDRAGKLFAPYLRKANSQKGLRLGRIDYGWNSTCRFLFVQR